MRVMVTKPIYKFRHSYVSTNVTTAAWVEIITAMPVPASAVEIFDGSGRIIKLALGAAGDEDSNELDYYIIPGGSSILLPVEFARTKRVAAKAVDANATTGSLVFNFFG